MPYTKEQLDKWFKAGKLAAELKELARSLVKRDTKIIDVVEKIE